MKLINPRDLQRGHRLEGIGEAPTIAAVGEVVERPGIGEVVVVTFTEPDGQGNIDRELPVESDVSVLDDPAGP